MSFVSSITAEGGPTIPLFAEAI